MSRNAALAHALKRLKELGWLEVVGGTAPQTANVSRMVDCLFHIEALLGKLLLDHTDADPADTRLLVTLKQIREDLQRAEYGVAPVTIRVRGRARNARGADPAIVRLKILIGVYARQFGSNYPTPNQLHSDISSALGAGGHPMSERAVSHALVWFNKGVAGQLHGAEWRPEFDQIVTHVERDTMAKRFLAGSDVIKGSWLAHLTAYAESLRRRPRF